jgi:hypothetical protein
MAAGVTERHPLRRLKTSPFLHASNPTAYVRFGSKADVGAPVGHVCSRINSRHWGITQSTEAQLRYIAEKPVEDD